MSPDVRRLGPEAVERLLVDPGEWLSCDDCFAYLDEYVERLAEGETSGADPGGATDGAHDGAPAGSTGRASGGATGGATGGAHDGAHDGATRTSVGESGIPPGMRAHLRGCAACLEEAATLALLVAEDTGRDPSTVLALLTD